MSGPPEVTVLIPSCDRRAILERCLAALAAQTHRRFEVVVVDDCSSDGTPQMLEDFAEAHPELDLRCLRNSRHRGANPSRNRGIRAARSPLVAFLDSDCIAEPDWLEKLAAGFARLGRDVGAVNGLVTDPPPRNVAELTFRGTHRVTGAGPSRRLIACNMAVRRDLLLRFMLDEDRAGDAPRTDGRVDTSVSGRGDEEGLYLQMRAAGYRVMAVPDAVVLHDHQYTWRSLLRQAWRGGGAAARLVYKYHLPPRLDMLPFVLAYATLPLGLLRPWLLGAPAFFMLAALAAITYNDLARKGKTPGQTLRSFPMLVVYYHVRLGGYVTQTLRLWLTRAPLERVRLSSETQG